MNYLYNSVPLPDIYTVYPPELQATHPCATMVTTLDSAIEEAGRVTLAYLIFSTMPLTYVKGGVLSTYLAASADGSTIRYLINTVGGVTWDNWQRDADKDGAFVAGGNVQVITAITKVRWANYDILNEDGTLYLAASDPVPISTYTPNPAAMLKGMLVGQAVRRMRGMKQPEQPEEGKTLVGYLYNGVQAPDISEVMADGHPYGLIYQRNATGAYYLLNCQDTANPAQGFLTYSDGQLVSTSGVGIYGMRNILSGGAWVYEQTVMGKTLSLDGITLIWTNTDIPNADGSTYLAATEPVPVYA